MTGRRGLTLLEVLASAVLLAVLAAACVPLLAAAMRDLEDVQPPFEYAELVEFVDSLLAQGADGGPGPASSATAGAAEWQKQMWFAGTAEAETEVPWPVEKPDRSPVRVRRLRADQDARHGWLVFSAGAWTVCRWVEVPGEERAGLEGGSP